MLAAYIERKRFDDVVALVWRRFEERPASGTYTRLRAWCQRAGAWDERRQAALDRLYADAERAASAPRSARATATRRWAVPAAPPPYQTLVEVLMWDDAADEAWSLATEHGCTQSLWMDLARAREREHPLDAVGVYRREVEQLIDRKQTHTYRSAVELIALVGDLFTAAGGVKAFDDYVAELRHRHKLKTKFLGLLTEQGP